VKTPEGQKAIPLADVAPRKCATCQLATPLQYDVLAGEAIQSNKPQDTFEETKEFEKLPLKERRAYWEKEFDRCIRCYACRNACPMCICQDRCIAESRDPHWTSQRANVTEKSMFHMIHGLHLAGRCISCEECERVCPMDIPVAKIKKKISMDLKELFNYEAGMNPDDTPPLYTFKIEEATIKEHEL
jgi:formate hydrogenlyase subunit 6/NADH:ubiquinone oxidoreductase subunit I